MNIVIALLLYIKSDMNMEGAVGYWETYFSGLYYHKTELHDRYGVFLSPIITSRNIGAVYGNTVIVAMALHGHSNGQIYLSLLLILICQEIFNYCPYSTCNLEEIWLTQLALVVLYIWLNKLLL